MNLEAAILVFTMNFAKSVSSFRLPKYVAQQVQKLHGQPRLGTITDGALVICSSTTNLFTQFYKSSK